MRLNNKQLYELAGNEAVDALLRELDYLHKKYADYVDGCHATEDSDMGFLVPVPFSTFIKLELYGVIK